MPWSDGWGATNAWIAAPGGVTWTRARRARTTTNPIPAPAPPVELFQEKPEPCQARPLVAHWNGLVRPAPATTGASRLRRVMAWLNEPDVWCMYTHRHGIMLGCVSGISMSLCLRNGSSLLMQFFFPYLLRKRTSFDFSCTISSRLWWVMTGEAR
jgi:hypothetical protein